MSYIDKIEKVATASYDSRTTLVHMITDKWCELERVASGFYARWDIFHPEFKDRELIRELIRLLYLTNTGDPESDCQQLRAKDKAYGGSWCRRGGPGAFMTMARKADRFLEQVDKYEITGIDFNVVDGAENLVDTIGDWRRYLILIEAWCVDRDTPPEEGWTPGGPEAH